MLSTEWNLNDENKNNFNPINWYITEKYDGIRAIWNGKHLITNNGRIIKSTPQSILNLLPNNEILDGELW